jgi:transposase
MGAIDVAHCVHIKSARVVRVPLDHRRETMHQEKRVHDVDRIQRERDVETLRQMALVLVRENQRLVTRILSLQKELGQAKGEDKAQLELQIAALEKELATQTTTLGSSGNPKSEKRGHTGEGEGDPKPPQKGHGPKTQVALPIEEQFHKLETADLSCPSCGNALAEWQGQTDDSDEIDLIERRFVVVRHRRQKYRCKCGHCETALGPKRWFGGGRYSAAFAIAVAIGKYLDHLPLERQARQMGRQGVDVDSNTLFDQCWALANIVRPAYERIPAVQREQLVLHVDETRWPMLDGKQQGKSWHIWDIVSDVAAYYAIRDGRGGVHAEALLADFNGYVMSDGYIVYESLAKRYPTIRHVACLVHARRKFVECSEAFPQETERILNLIAELYRIEKEADTIERRGELRKTRSRAVMAELQRVLMEIVAIPGSALEAAIRYTAKRWSKLTRFLDDPRLPLDNNAAERALRGPVVGRKNHYGSKSRRGTEVAAIFYSLLESAKLVGVEPAMYLRRCVEAHLAGAIIPLPHELRAP